jgi:methylmalonyl-CoA mutase N-terminal domain/subunit
LRTQQVIGFETNIPAVADPLAGSYLVESLTAEMEAAAEGYFAAIEEQGGMLAAIENGYPQREIADAAFRFQQQLERGDRVIVGVNAFTETVDASPPPILRIEPEVEREQVRALKRLRESRDNTSVATRLEALREVATGSDNVMPALLDCVRVRATEGEIIAALRDVFGSYHETPSF